MKKSFLSKRIKRKRNNGKNYKSKSIKLFQICNTKLKEGSLKDLKKYFPKETEKNTGEGELLKNYFSFGRQNEKHMND